MALRWAWNFGLNLPTADMASLGWVASDAVAIDTADTTAGALNTPEHGTVAGDSHVATVASSQNLQTPLFFGTLPSGTLDDGAFCARLKWVTGDAVASAVLLCVQNAAGATLLSLTAETSGTSHRIQCTGGDATVLGTRVFAVGETVDLALVYDFTAAVGTFTLYLDGVADLTGTRTDVAQTVGRFALGSNGGTLSWNTLRFYDAPVTDLAEAVATNKWIELLAPDQVTQTGWTTEGTPTDDVDALTDDLTTGLSTDAARSLTVGFADTALAADATVDAVGAFVIGTPDGLAGSVRLDDDSGTLGTVSDAATSGSRTYLPVFEANSQVQTLSVADVNAMTAVLSFA